MARLYGLFNATSRQEETDRSPEERSTMLGERSAYRLDGRALLQPRAAFALFRCASRREQDVLRITISPPELARTHAWGQVIGRE
jgi:hypothetical protein